MANNSDDIHSIEWELEVRILEGISISFICIAAYSLLSLVLFGTKTRRWKKKPSTSSLNTGSIYVVCFLAVTITFLRLSITEVVYMLPRIDNGLQVCNLLCDAANIMYGLSTMACYGFLWLLQRKIYNHPCVKPRIRRCVDILSKISVVPLSLAGIGVSIASGVLHSFKGSQAGCMLIQNDQDTVSGLGTNIVCTAVVIISQSIIFGLSVYPLINAKFEVAEGAGMHEHSLSREQSSAKTFLKFAFPCCDKGQKIPQSPIEMATRRATVSGGVMVISNAVTLILAFFLFPSHAPVALRQTMYDISAIINILCIVSTLGRTAAIFLSCLPCGALCRKKTFTYGSTIQLDTIDDIKINGYNQAPDSKKYFVSV